jgi:hypothetical protein
LKNLFGDLIYHPALTSFEAPLLFQEGSFDSQSVKYMDLLIQEGSGIAKRDPTS